MDLSPSLLVLLPLLGWCGAQHILPEGPVDVLLGGNATLTTLLDKPEYQFIIWNFNNGDEQVHVATLTRSNLKVNAPYRDRVAIDGATGNLFLKETKSADSGDYSITVLTVNGDTTTAEIKLRVLEPVSEVTIRSDLPEAIEHNSTVVLTCSAKGSFLRFTWANGTKTLVPDGKRITLKEEQRTSTMTIAGVLRWDLRGPISCLADNGLESMRSAPFNLTVYYGPELVALAPPSPPPFIKAGSDFNLTCSAVSSPDATFQWFRDQQLMEASGSVLTLKTLQEHSGAPAAAQYWCGATNSKTRRTLASAPVSFAVIGPILGVNLSGPSGVLFAGNGSANLSCWAEAGEVTTTTWRKDGRALSAGGRVLFAADMRSIRIEPLQKEDNGQFACELSNQVDRQEASYQMVVNYGPEEPTVTGEKVVEVNQRVTLTCSAPSVPPANFTWKVNGSATGVNTATFVVDKAAYKNTGTYTCEAHNTVTGGRGQVTHFLAVKEEGSLEGLSGGAIAGIVIGILAPVGVAIGLFVYCR
ncbi:unnamed protein product, partial [Tetraodon nigroviridis]